MPPTYDRPPDRCRNENCSLVGMAPRKKNLHKRDTVKVPYVVLYTHKTAEEKPQEPRDREETIREAAEQSRSARNRKPVPSFAKKK